MHNPKEFVYKASEKAFHGLAGLFVTTVSPHSEAGRMALLGQFLVAFGNCVDRHAYYLVEADRHFTNLFVVVVGRSSKARKGISWGWVRRVFEAVDPEWCNERVVTSIPTGEGLINTVRDATVQKEPVRKAGKIEGYEDVIIDHGVKDKRLMAVISEYGGMLTQMSRVGNTLSAVVRDAWDGVILSNLTKNSPMRATGALVSIAAHITLEELHKRLSGIDAINGFANRFLWIYTSRSKKLPLGGEVPQAEMHRLVCGLKAAVAFGKKAGRLMMSEEAKTYWTAIYNSMDDDTPGDVGAVIARGEPQILRLSLIYAILDLSNVIEKVHIEAAAAVWAYAEESARFIFSEKAQDTLKDKLSRLVLRNPNGISRTEIRDEYSGHGSAEAISAALTELEEEGKVRRVVTKTGGRPKETWYAVMTVVVETAELPLDTRCELETDPDIENLFGGAVETQSHERDKQSASMDIENLFGDADDAEALEEAVTAMGEETVHTAEDELDPDYSCDVEPDCNERVDPPYRDDLDDDNVWG